MSKSFEALANFGLDIRYFVVVVAANKVGYKVRIIHMRRGGIVGDGK
jgi:hypothetical protein